MDLSDSVVVITGASSGIGRATAHAFAKRGAALVLAARSAEALRAVTDECAERGGRPLAIGTDIGKEDQVRRLARRALEAFGRIDIWINDAAVTLFGRIEDLPDGSFEQVIHTNLVGYAYGARAVLPIFRAQHRGTLINVASVVAFVGQPFTSAYVASKWGIRGLSECLRMEVMEEPDIHVCTVYPPSVDTPLYQHGGNYLGRPAQPIPPIHAPEEAAQVIVNVALDPRREAFVGREPVMARTAHAIAPKMLERMIARKVDQQHFQDHPAPPSAGNLSRPMWDAVSGGWRQAEARRRQGNGVSTGMMLAGAAALASALPLGIYAWQRLRERPAPSSRRVAWR